MGIQIRLPNITGASEKEQLVQLKSYLYQLSEELQWAFDNIDTTAGSGNGYVVNQAPRGFTASPGAGGVNAEATFAAIKALIIKSADIVNAYYEEINAKLEGAYVAQSDFGTFAEKTTQDIEANSTGITQTFENVQIIIRDTKAEIDGDLQTLGEDLSYAQNDIITITGNIEGIGTEIAGLETDIGDLDTELSGKITDTANDLNGNIGDAVNSANAYTDAAKEEAKGYTDGAKSELDGKINDANGRIDETNGNVSKLGDGLDAANNRLDAADKALEESKIELGNAIRFAEQSASQADLLRQAAEESLKGSIDDLKVKFDNLGNAVVKVTGFIKSGIVRYTDEGIPVLGLSIGQEVDPDNDGVSEFKKHATFTSDRLSFYDANGREVAYISDKKLYIDQAQITTSLKVGGLIDLVMANGDVITKWEGGS